MDALALAVAAALVLFGRSLYWLFVGGIGFLLGFHYASGWLSDSPAWLILLAALGVGIVGAVLAILLQRLAIAAAAFVGAGWFAVSLLPALGVDARFEIPAFVVAGLLAAILTVALLDPALVILSSAIGASMISTSTLVDPAWRWIVFGALLALGIAVQFSMLRRARPTASPPPA